MKDNIWSTCSRSPLHISLFSSSCRWGPARSICRCIPACTCTCSPCGPGPRTPGCPPSCTCAPRTPAPCPAASAPSSLFSPAAPWSAPPRCRRCWCGRRSAGSSPAGCRPSSRLSAGSPAASGWCGGSAHTRGDWSRSSGARHPGRPRPRPGAARPHREAAWPAASPSGRHWGRSWTRPRQCSWSGYAHGAAAALRAPGRHWQARN